ncbi:GAF and ANTAR domain-containing protein [Streptomyces sp. ALI-76-A]|jgi:GAF domain-containing protein|uniref:GAF and ANTAR domain-containing protein n=1 Tax=Streptomyces sp. ALI-76-A TaxID=3025736 RepID=UPI00256F0871|nr:GAF and ANTAR domain-containing protein [Streptomyces sp. ALI-76-A]MDL5199299.1 GAF and ANTAR domain-containing protein [Streptomyces sp. ALI-76-A]
MSADNAYGSSQLTQWLLETKSLEDFLQTLADAALELSRAEGAGLTLERDGRPLTVVSAGAAATKLDEKQYGQDDGPCLQSLRTGEELLVRDMLRETRWDDYPAYAAACGIRSSLSLPIAADTHTACALNLYAGPPNAFEQVDLQALRSLASQATGAVALAQRIADTQDFADQMQAAMQSRSVIDQALGVVMGQNRCTADEAFGILRSASQHRNIKLRDLCVELITNLTGRPPTAPELRHRP